jgi:hypothetical protein
VPRARATTTSSCNSCGSLSPRLTRRRLRTDEPTIWVFTSTCYPCLVSLLSSNTRHRGAGPGRFDSHTANQPPQLQAFMTRIRKHANNSLFIMSQRRWHKTRAIAADLACVSGAHLLSLTCQPEWPLTRCKLTQTSPATMQHKQVIRTRPTHMCTKVYKLCVSRPRVLEHHTAVRTFCRISAQRQAGCMPNACASLCIQPQSVKKLA